MQVLEEQVRLAADRVGDEVAGGDLRLRRFRNRVLVRLQQPGRQRDGLLARQAGMAVVARLLEREADAGAQPLRCIARCPERGRHLVGGQEADAAHVAGETVRVLPDQPDGLRPERPVHPRRLAEAKSVLLQEHAEVAHDPVLGPALGDPPDPRLGEAGDLLQPVRLGIQHLEGPPAEGLDDLVGGGDADALDGAGGEIFLDAVLRGRRRGHEAARPELQAMGAVVHPAALRGHHLAGGDLRGRADDGDRLRPPAHPHLQHGKAGCRRVEGDAFDRAGEGLNRAVGRRRGGACAHGGESRVTMDGKPRQP